MVIKTTPKGTKRPARKGTSRVGTLKTAVYSVQDRAAALTLIDYYGGIKKKGAMSRAAKVLGMPRATLTAWAKDRYGNNSEIMEAKADIKRSLAERFEDACGKMIVISVRAAEVAAERGNVRGCTIGTAIFADKRNLMLELPTTITKTIEAKTGDGVVDQERQQYETLLANIIAEHKASGIALSREEAIERLLQYKPEAARILKIVPAPPVAREA